MQSWSVRNNSHWKTTRCSMCVKVKWPCLAQLLMFVVLLLGLYGNHAYLRLVNFKSLLIWKMFLKIDLMKNDKHSYRRKDVIHVFFYKLPYMSLICNLWCNHFLLMGAYDLRTLWNRLVPHPCLENHVPKLRSHILKITS